MSAVGMSEVGERHNPGQFRWFLHLLGESSWAVARQLHLFYARRPPDKLSKSLPVFFFFFKGVWFFKIGKLLSLKEHIFFQSILPKLSG